MKKYTINKDHAFTEFEYIELDLNENLPMQEIMIKDEKLNIVKLKTFFFILKNFTFYVIVLLLITSIFMYNFPLLSIVYISLSILVFIIIDKLCMIKYMDIIAFISYALHGVYFFLSKDINGIIWDVDTGTFMILGAFSFHLILNILKTTYQYAKVHEIKEEFPTGNWYLWQSGFSCKGTR